MRKGAGRWLCALATLLVLGVCGAFLVHEVANPNPNPNPNPNTITLTLTLSEPYHQPQTLTLTSI